MALADIQGLVDNLVRDESGATGPDVRDQAIALAVLRYSQDVERRATEDVAWSASGCFGTLPAGWVAGSYLIEAEYPVGQVPRSLVEMSIYQAPDGQLLAVPQAIHTGELVRVVFAVPHALTGEDDGALDTTAPEHREALASYAASLLCKQLATKYSGERDSSISADHSNTESRARNFAARARDYRAAYYAGIGKLDPQSDKGGSAAPGTGQAPAAAIGTLPGRSRNRLTAGAVL